MQVSISASKFDSGRPTHLFCFQGQEGGQDFVPLLLSDLITNRRAVFRNASPVLAAV